jgi:peroxiredoxin
VGQKAVVLNFWYPSCPPCRAEMPGFEKAWQELQGEDVRFLGLFVPQGLDSEQDARGFVEELGLTYDFATDKGASTAQAYQLEYFPTTYFIDKKGRVFRAVISTLDAEKIADIVREMMQG